MDMLVKAFTFFMHLDAHLVDLISDYHAWTYLILFLVIFAETGLVICPFLPGDSLLLAAGAVAARPDSLDIRWLWLLLCVATILGDSTNYWIGRFTGPKIFHKEGVRLLNRKHLERAHAFYQKHGGKTVVIARFLPILRTFSPFVAGIGKMDYLRFLTFSVLGTLMWITTFVLGGYKLNKQLEGKFGYVIVVIIFISLLPAGIAFLQQKRADARERKATNQ